MSQCRYTFDSPPLLLQCGCAQNGRRRPSARADTDSEYEDIDDVIDNSLEAQKVIECKLKALQHGRGDDNEADADNSDGCKNHKDQKRFVCWA